VTKRAREEAVHERSHNRFILSFLSIDAFMPYLFPALQKSTPPLSLTYLFDEENKNKFTPLIMF
jgi:hypothetical protein